VKTAVEDGAKRRPQPAKPPQAALDLTEVDPANYLRRSSESCSAACGLAAPKAECSART